MASTRNETSVLRAAIKWLRSPGSSEPRAASAPAQPGSESLFIR
jgi:hypothetical protein